MKNEVPHMSLHEVLRYEVNASWWAGYISDPRLQEWAGKYYAAKARRKFARLRNAELNQSRLNALRLAGLI